MDFSKFAYNNKVDLLSTADNTGWPDNILLTYANYIKIYDAYADWGWRSTDGAGTPIAILYDYRDEEGNQVDNAGYGGNMFGWQVLCSSEINRLGEGIDVMAHEYTHGFTNAVVTGSPYQGETGLLNEAFSDMQGNLIERMVTGDADPDWLLGEDTGDPARCMRDPGRYAQPTAVGGVFYGPMNAEINPFNDNAGVHINSSLFSSIAVDLSDAGMSDEEQRALWLSVECAMVPRTGFKELLPIAKFTADACGMGKWKGAIESSFQKHGLTADLNKLIWKDEADSGRVTFRAEPSGNRILAKVAMMSPETGEMAYRWMTWADSSGLVTVSHPAGDYVVAAMAIDMESGEKTNYFFSANGWTTDISAAQAVTVSSGKPVELPDLTPILAGK